MSSPPKVTPSTTTSVVPTPQDLLNQKLLALRKQKEEAAKRRHNEKKSSADKSESKKSFFQAPKKIPPIAINTEQKWGTTFIAQNTKFSTATSAIEQLKLLKSVKSKEPEVSELSPPTAPPEELERLANLEKTTKLEKEKAAKLNKAAKIERLVKSEKAQQKNNDARTSKELAPDSPEPAKKNPSVVSQNIVVRPISLPILSSQRKMSGKMPLPQLDFVSSKNKLTTSNVKQDPPNSSAETAPKVPLQLKTGATNIAPNKSPNKFTPSKSPAPQTEALKRTSDQEGKSKQTPQATTSSGSSAPQAKPLVAPLQNSKDLNLPQSKPVPVPTQEVLTTSPSVISIKTLKQETKTEDSSIPFVSVQDQKVKIQLSPGSASVLVTQSSPNKGKRRKSADGLEPKKKNASLKGSDSVTVLQFTDSWDQIDEEEEMWGEDRRVLAIERAPSSYRPRNPTESDLDILRPGKDEAEHITIIPVDESKIVDQELSNWKKHRFTFHLFFVLVLVMGIAITSMSLYASLYVYNVKNASGAPTTYFMAHTDTMIFISTSLSALGILIFRLFPDAPKHILRRAHVIIFTLFYAAFIYAFIVAIEMHKDITTQEPHMYTIHAAVSIMIVGFMVYEIGSGLYLIFKPNSPSKRYHWAVGMISFLSCGACCASGYLARATSFEDLVNPNMLQLVVINTTAVLILVFCCVVRYMETEFRFRRRSSPEWDAVSFRSTTNFEEENINNPNLTMQQYVRNTLRARHYRQHHE